MSARPPEWRQANGRVQAARRDLALAEESYRALLERVTGQRSARHCTAADLDAVAAECRRLGWRPRRGARAASAPRPGAASGRKAVALWIALHHLGAVADPSDAALARYAARMTRSPDRPEGVERLVWLDAAGWGLVIDGLHAWAERVGYPRAMRADVARIARERRQHLGPRAPRPGAGHAEKVLLVEVLLSRAQHAGVGLGLRAIAVLGEYAPEGRPLAVCGTSALDECAARLGGLLRDDA